VIALNRTELQPWWGAWQPWLLVISAAGVIVCLMLSWALLAGLYSLPTWLAAFYANRDWSLCASWKLSVAVLLPGALLMAGSILLYALAVLDLVHLMLLFGAHILLGWVYLIISPWFLASDSASATRSKNPFAPPSTG
jgi:hypothetical protein